jgi:hypothetical protein
MSLLEKLDAEDLRAEVGRHRAACGLHLNRAAELLSLAAAVPAPMTAAALVTRNGSLIVPHDS